MSRHAPKTFLDVSLANGHYVGPTHTHNPAHSSSSSTSLLYGGYSSYAGPASWAISPLTLSSAYEEPTRVRLHRQRLKEHYQVSDKIPGLKTSAAFFASLRTNLRLHASPPPSPMSTPSSMIGSAASLPPPSPLSAPADSAVDNEITTAEDPLAGVPELKSYRAEDDDEKIAALKLVADSVAQQRQTANTALITNYVNMAALTAVLALLARFMHDRHFDPIAIGTTCMGALMSFLAFCKWYTKDYIFRAEEINWEWLGDADVLVTKFGDEIIGALVVDWCSGESRQKRKKAWRGEIKGWAVRIRYRGKGVGSALLEDAVKEARSKGAESIEFADDHANSMRILPNFYNGSFEKRERKSRELLQDFFEASPIRGKRK